MSEQEVITCLKEHLKYCMNRYKVITKERKRECICMIMDFLPKLSKEQAEALFEDKILFERTEDSKHFDNIRYQKYINGIVVEIKQGKTLMIDNSDIGIFTKELQTVGGAI